MFLLDTNVVSELRKAASGKANPRVISWAREIPVIQLYVSVVTILEIETGILSVERRDARQGTVLRTWLNTHVLPAFSDRILPIDTTIALKCASLHVPAPCSDRDALIAATALVHGMTVVTRNTQDFEKTGVKLLNPWEN